MPAQLLGRQLVQASGSQLQQQQGNARGTVIKNSESRPPVQSAGITLLRWFSCTGKAENLQGSRKSLSTNLKVVGSSAGLKNFLLFPCQVTSHSKALFCTTVRRFERQMCVNWKVLSIGFSNPFQIQNVLRERFLGLFINLKIRNLWLHMHTWVDSIMSLENFQFFRTEVENFEKCWLLESSTWYGKPSNHYIHDSEIWGEICIQNCIYAPKFLPNLFNVLFKVKILYVLYRGKQTITKVPQKHKSISPSPMTLKYNPSAQVSPLSTQKHMTTC